MRIIILALLLMSSGLHASEESKREKLMELVNVMDMDSMVDAMYSQMESMMQNMSTEMGITPSEKPIFDEYYRKMTAVLKEEVSWQKMRPIAVDIYDRNFNEAEITDMLNFYKTPTGQSILQKMPIVMQDSMQMSQGLVQNALPKIQAIAAELSADLEAERNPEQ
ncbi:DUF2059 domain-containing protein [Gilvimarinus sp. SDUM040013]|uniref:DUF2059 domain-containing protein n=1 Tax=Gilvimarinus gilvus TaxID=3058038 RepID=A0ABU4S456_9GAMM|nr:DUF2059 domain-containing protein [Gilvimarinus sp. SDUM040013]MDO3385810.1 DUF2059 domain-containing protein [Gilvimarinus sp. SDUM040013]MDX6850628.1 DUF2059 domain-containing protein [Gilvimarinus sp. SDUM040013]